MFEFFKTPIVIKELRSKLTEVQHSLDILIGGAVENQTLKGNPYPGYAQAITELARKYEGVAEWGVLQARNIIDIRSAFIIGQGLKLVSDEKESREMVFIQALVKQNNLDEEMPQEFAKEAEIEGRMCVKLIPNADTTKQTIDLRFVSYSTHNYKVHASKDDYQKYEKITYYDKEKGETTIPEMEFVYKKFAGRVNKVNEVMPKTAMILRHCEALDKALYDWRESNYLFAVPTPYFKCLTKEEVDNTYNKLKVTNWKLGKMFVGTAEFSLVEMSGSGLASLEKEIITLAKFISGATGVPVHFLGLPDLMSNRAVSTDLFELINASTNKERHIWQGFYEELFDKAILMANAQFKLGLRPGIVKAMVLAITEAKIRELVEVWYPLYNGGVIDLDYMLSKIPDIDPDKVKAAQKEAALKQLEQIKAYEQRMSQEVPV